MRPSRHSQEHKDSVKAAQGGKEPRKLVLCIDDQEAILTMLKTSLEAHGYSVLVSSSGHEALKLAAHPVDAVILDYHMPDLNGIEVAAEIRRSQPHTPIILFSGEPRNRTPPRALTLADAFIEKGDMSVLLAGLRSVLETPLPKPPAFRRFPRYRVQLPFGIVANRSGELEMYRGFSTDMGEGGIGGKVDGELVLSEFVLLQMSHSPLGIQLDPRAQVRYRNNEIYGFEFLDIAPEQRGVVRRFCKLLGSQ